MNTQLTKKYVDVILINDAEGNIRPLSITIDDRGFSKSQELKMYVVLHH